MIVLEISLHSNTRGRGFWKLNTSFLIETEYINQIKLIIQQTKDEYREDEFIVPCLQCLFSRLRKYLVFFSPSLYHRDFDLIIAPFVLYSINDSNCSFFASSSVHICCFRESLICISLKSCSNFATDCSISSNSFIIFFFLEAPNFIDSSLTFILIISQSRLGLITQLKIREKDFADTDKEILNECESFYQTLYSSKTNNEKSSDVFFPPQQNQNYLTNAEQLVCEGLLNREECLQVLNSMNSVKTPGTDGLPCEFYKIFWNDVSDILVSSFKYSYETGTLSVSQRRGIVKRIPKKDADLSLIKNWRPLTLLNCDYKIATKAIANRIKFFLPKLISDDQTGFIKNRFIGENILLIVIVIRYTAARNIPGLLLFLDFEKAFDTLEWTFIQKTLKCFGYGPQLLKWINIFYCNTESCILNNGWASNFFKPTRGVRQGCPLSPYLFVLSVEAMAEAFRKNEKIRGITVKAKNIKLSQYADDTTLILDGSIESLEESLRLLDLFGEVSGLRLNCGKTEALWIGAKVNSDLKLCPENNFKCPKGKVKALGFWFSSDSNITVSRNYIDKVEKVKAMLSCWKFRRLSLLGKITVIKSLAVSQLVYILAPLQTNHKAIKEINVLFYKFLWDGKGDKIKRNVMINDFSEGGLKMIDIES